MIGTPLSMVFSLFIGNLMMTLHLQFFWRRKDMGFVQKRAKEVCTTKDWPLRYIALIWANPNGEMKQQHATNPVSDRNPLMRSSLLRFPMWRWYAKGQPCIWNPRRIRSWPPSNEMLKCFVDELDEFPSPELREGGGWGRECPAKTFCPGPSDHIKEQGQRIIWRNSSGG